MSDIDVYTGAPSIATLEFQTIAQKWLESIDGEAGGPGLPVNSSSSVYEAAHLVKAGPGTLFGFAIYNSKNAGQFIQAHDTQAAPGSGAIPVAVWTVATVANLNVAWVIPGRFFSRGIWLVNSSTGPTLTAGSADCWFDAQYV